MNNVSQPRVQIFIMSRNRKGYLLQSLESCLSLNYSNFEVLVSDNSTQPEIRTLLAEHPQNKLFKVILRDNLSYLEHTNTILSEVTAPYFMIFHDDDVMLPNCLNDYVEVMQKNAAIAAVGGNARVLLGDHLSDRQFMKLTKDRLVKTPGEFIESYYVNVQDHPAFPTYLYRSEHLKNLRLSKASGGVHADSSFLFELVKRGGLYFTKSVVAQYRFHTQNISAKLNAGDLNKMCRYLIAQAPEYKIEVLNYKYTVWLKYFLIRQIRLKGLRLNRREYLMLGHVLSFFARHPLVFLNRFIQKVRRA